MRVCQASGVRLERQGAPAGGCYNSTEIATGSFTLRINVLLFASYRERAGTAELGLELPDGSTVADMIGRLLEAHPNIASDPSRLVVAVNREYQEHGHTLVDGDEAALIPPVSGGCK